MLSDANKLNQAKKTLLELITAPRHLLYGDTIYSSLRLSLFQNLAKQLLNRVKTKLSNEISQVKYVIIKKKSMVRSELLWDIYHRGKIFFIA